MSDKHTQDVEVVESAGLSAGGIVVAEEAVQGTLGEEVAENAITAEDLLGVTASDVAGAALALGMTHGGRVGQAHVGLLGNGCDGGNGHGQGQDGGEAGHLHSDRLEV
jgi:hypothetical protein